MLPQRVTHARIEGMRFRKLRIAWSVFWGVVCVLLIVLWVRSYSTRDEVIENLLEGNFEAVSVLGHLGFVTASEPTNQLTGIVASTPITSDDSWIKAQRSFFFKSE